MVVLAAATVPVSAQTSVDSKQNSEQKAAVKELIATVGDVHLQQLFNPMLEEIVRANEEQKIESFKSLIEPLKTAREYKVRESRGRQMAGIILRLGNTPQIEEYIEQIMGNLYSKHFSVDEIKTLTAFYKTSAGRKIFFFMLEVKDEAIQKITPTMKHNITKIALSEIKFDEAEEERLEKLRK